ncbi:hypothetical protein C3L29_036315, partial [Pseudomonas sp. MWU12-2534b]
LWFDDPAGLANWSIDTPPSALSAPDAHGRPLYGIGADVAVDTNTLTIRQGVLSNVRFLRDFSGGAAVPQQILTAPTVQGGTEQWQRDRIDGAPGYSLRITLRDGGGIAPAAGGKLVLSAPAGSHTLRLHVDALSGETPLSPITRADLLAPSVNPDPVSQNVLEFL